MDDHSRHNPAYRPAHIFKRGTEISVSFFILYETDKVEYFGEGVFGKRRHPSEDRPFPCQHVAFP